MFDDLIPGEAATKKPAPTRPAGSISFDDIPSTQQPARTISGALRDVGATALKGAMSVPETAVGMADLVTGGRAGKLVQDAGIDFKAARTIADDMHSPAQQYAQRQVRDAKGFFPTVGASLSNPSTIVQSAAESLPSMALGALPARAVLPALSSRMAPTAAGAVAGGLGEGLVTAGQNAEQVRQETPTGLLTGQQAAIMAGSGALTGLIGGVSGRVANRLGIGDIDQAMLGQQQRAAVQAGATHANKGIVRRAAEGAVSEGVLEELPQSMQEQAAQNLALGKPMGEGVAEAGATGMLAGGLMGGVVGPLAGRGRNSAQQGAPEQPVGPPGAPAAPPDGAQTATANVPPAPPPSGPELRAQKLPDAGPLSSAVNAGLEAGAQIADAGPAAAPMAPAGEQPQPAGAGLAPDMLDQMAVDQMNRQATADQMMLRRAAEEDRQRSAPPAAPKPAAAEPQPGASLPEPAVLSMLASAPPAFETPAPSPDDVMGALQDIGQRDQQTRALYDGQTAQPPKRTLRQAQAERRAAKETQREQQPQQLGSVPVLPGNPVDGADRAAPAGPTVQPATAKRAATADQNRPAAQVDGGATPVAAPVPAADQQQGANDGQGQEGRRQEVLTAPRDGAAQPPQQQPNGGADAVAQTQSGSIQASAGGTTAPALGNTATAPRKTLRDAQAKRRAAKAPDAQEVVTVTTQPQGAPGSEWVADGIHKVYKTRMAANKAKKAAGNTQRMKAVKGGFILREATEKELAAAAAASRRQAQRTRSGGGPGLLAEVARMGGLDRKSASKDLGVHADSFGHKSGIFGAPTFRATGGKSAEHVLEALKEANYLPDSAGLRDLEDAIGRELGGDTVLPLDHDYTDDMQAALDAQRDVDDDTFADLDVEDLQAEGYTSATPEVQALTEQLLSEANALGIDSESLRERVAMETESETDDQFYAAVQESVRRAIAEAQADAERRDAGAARPGSEDRGRPAEAQGGSEQGLKLEAQTPDDLKSKAAREEAAATAEQTKRAAEQDKLSKEAEQRDNRARADATVDDFQIGQSAERQMSGIADLFADAPATEDTAAAQDAPPEQTTPLAKATADPFANDYTDLNGKTITRKLQTEAGEATLKMDAGEALRAQQQRLDKLQALKKCIGA